ncbi:MAG: restriction endonuclease [Burkholderiales bacterium]
MSRIKPLAFAAGAARSLGALWSVLRGEETAAKAALRLKLGLKLDTRRWNPELLKQLEWRRFEEVCAAYYETLGFAVAVSGAGTPAGVAMVIRDQDAKTHSIARCKAWDAHRVGPKAVRELRRAMDAAKIADGVLLTSGRFTHDAVSLATQEGIRLIDGPALLEKIGALTPEKALALLQFATQGDFLSPTCPLCSVKMISRQSTKDGRKYWGCRNYPACKQTFAGTASAPA